MSQETFALRQIIQALEERIVDQVNEQQSLRDFLKAESIGIRESVMKTFLRMSHWEFAATLITTAYGLFLISPLDTLIIIGLDQDSNIFLRHAAEALWGVAFCISGISQMIAARMNWLSWRIMNSALMASIWAGIVYLYSGIYPGSTAGFLSGVVAFCAVCAIGGLLHELARS